MADAAGRTGFPRSVRLLSPGDFSRVFAARWTAASGPLVLYACPVADVAQPARLGLSVSRRIGNAVVRNRWKRRLREAFRHVRSALPTGNDFVIVVRSGAAPTGSAGAGQIERMIEELAARVMARPGYAAQHPGSQPAALPVRRRR